MCAGGDVAIYKSVRHQTVGRPPNVLVNTQNYLPIAKEKNEQMSVAPSFEKRG